MQLADRAAVPEDDDAVAKMSEILVFRAREQECSSLLRGIPWLNTWLLSFMPESWDNRMRTIGSYQQDHSAMSRIIAWKTAINIANDRISGGGLAVATRTVFARYSDDPDWVITAHSIYFQALGEQGYIGLALFLIIGATTLRSTMELRRLGRQRPETLWLYELGGMIQVSMAGFAVGGAFLSLAYFDLPYDIAVIVIAGKYWLREERWRIETQGAFGATAPRGLDVLKIKHA